MLQSRAFRAVNLEVVRILARRYNVLRLLDPDSGPHRVSELLGLGRLQGVLSLHIICRMWELSHRRSVRPFLEESRPRLHLQKSPPPSPCCTSLWRSTCVAVTGRAGSSSPCAQILLSSLLELLIAASSASPSSSAASGQLAEGAGTLGHRVQQGTGPIPSGICSTTATPKPRPKNGCLHYVS